MNNVCSFHVLEDNIYKETSIKEKDPPIRESFFYLPKERFNYHQSLNLQHKH